MDIITIRRETPWEVVAWCNQIGLSQSVASTVLDHLYAIAPQVSALGEEEQRFFAFAESGNSKKYRLWGVHGAGLQARPGGNRSGPGQVPCRRSTHRFTTSPRCPVVRVACRVRKTDRSEQVMSTENNNPNPAPPPISAQVLEARQHWEQSWKGIANFTASTPPFSTSPSLPPLASQKAASRNPSRHSRRSPSKPLPSARAAAKLGVSQSALSYTIRTMRVTWSLASFTRRSALSTASLSFLTSAWPAGKLGHARRHPERLARLRRRSGNTPGRGA